VPKPETPRSSGLRNAWVAVIQAIARSWQVMFPMRTDPPLTTERVSAVEVPCRGDAFVFAVTMRELWTYPADTTGIENLVRRQQQENVRRLRAIARRFSADAAPAFEEECNRAFGSPACAGAGAVVCAISIQASPDVEIRARMREQWMERLAVTAEHELKDLRLSYLMPRHDAWLAFLKRLDDDPLAKLAAQLANDPEQLDAVLSKRATEQANWAKELRDLCDTTAQAYRDMGVFEFVNQTDSAMSRLLRHVGIDPNSPPPNSNGSG
jgi:hypothetical protein